MKYIVAILALLYIAISPLCAQENLGIRKLVCPEYPELARHAKIEGEVRLTLRVQRDGHIKSVHVLDGPKLLADSASKNVMMWEYVDRSQDKEIEVTFRYRLEAARTREREVPTITLQSPTLIEIVSRPPLTIEEKISIPKPKSPAKK